jgi:hypothetical protein
MPVSAPTVVHVILNEFRISFGPDRAVGRSYLVLPLTQ